MNPKIRAKLDKLIELTEEFGFDVGMHNKCFDDAVKKRLEKFGEDSEEFATHTLGLIETRIRYLKEKAKWWHNNRPEHRSSAMKWTEVIKNKEYLNEFNDAAIGTILAIARPGKFSGRDYALKTENNWVEIANIVTNQEVFNAELTGKVWNVEEELLPRFDNISMVYEGFDGIHPRHITDLKVLPIGSKVKTSQDVYVKTQSESWKLDHPDSKEIEDSHFITVLQHKTVQVI